jgi:ribonuclease HI
METLKKVEIFTDGACSGNPGPGGYGVILRYNGVEKELSGGDSETTNNRMELTAAIEGLSALKEPCEVTLYSDSKYLVDAYLLGWVEGWRKAGWRRGREALKNPDLWERLYSLTEMHKVTFVWVKGHNGHDYNERCDALATAFADSL